MAERLADLKTPDGAPPGPRYDPPPTPRPDWKAQLRARLPERSGPRPKPPKPPKQPKISGDMVIGGIGVALGLVCALFPWYIFMNPEKFKLEGYHFSGSPQAAHAGSTTYQPARIGAPMKLTETSRAALDMFPTGTVPEPGSKPAAGDKDQPFPGDTPKEPEFNLIEVANGRAMIEDADGLWIVQVGSPLPNDSRVAAIEKRGGDWVLVTSANDVVSLRK